MIQCVTIDDEPLALKLLEQHIGLIEDLELTGAFTDAAQGINFVQSNAVDLLFVDIDMPEINGLEVVEKLGQPKPLVIFTTAYRDYAVEGFQLDAVDYLLKPVTGERLTIAIEKVRKRMEAPVRKNPEYLTVHSEYKLIKIPLADILYIESFADYVKIYRIGQQHPILSLRSLKNLEKKLPADRFSRVHRSYIVGRRHIKAVRGKKLLLESGTELTVSQTYEDFLKSWKSEDSNFH